MEQKSPGESSGKRKNDENQSNSIASTSKQRKQNDDILNRQMLSATVEPLISFSDLLDGSDGDEEADLSPNHNSNGEVPRNEENDENDASVIGMQYGIIKNIMSFLSMQDLKNMSMVCQLWNAASKVEQRSLRRSLFVKSFSWEPSSVITKEHKSWRELQTSLTQHMEGASSGMNRFSRNNLLDQKIQAIESSPLQKDVQSYIKTTLENSMIEPSLAIIFSVGNIDMYEEYLVASKLVDPKTFHLDLAQVGNILPSNCEVISTCSRGVIVQTSESENLIVKEIENNGSRIHPAVTGFLLPSFEVPPASSTSSSNSFNKTIKVIPFDIPEYADYIAEKTDILSAIHEQKHTDVAMKEREIRRQLMKQVFCRNRLKDDDNIKCIITLSNVNENPSLLKLIHAAAVDWTSHHNLKSNQNIDSSRNQKWIPTLALGGVVGKLCRYSKGTTPSSLKGMLEEYDQWEQTNQESDDDADVLRGESSSSYKRSVGLIFAGDGIEAASVILPMSVRNESKVLKELQKLKDCKNLGNLDDSNSNSFAFMFACCGRGKYFYKEKVNVESKCFRSLFPNTPIIGIFGEGEYGWNYLPTENDLHQEKQSNEEMARNNHWFKELREDYICHSYTTVFVVLSVNSGNAKEDARIASSILQFANNSGASN